MMPPSSASPTNPEFLTVDDIVELHVEQLARYGGAAGLRDGALLDSAVAQPQASFGGEWLHPDLWMLAAAYLFHLVQNHPFVDGNERTGLLSTLVSLALNGIVLDQATPALYDLTMAVADGRLDKPAIAAALRQLAEAGRA
jgi:death-on-curing protein